MIEEAHGWKRKRRRLWVALSLMVMLLVVVLVPPMVSINRYKSRITGLMSTSLGRPVRLSSVEMRLLPTPGFVLTDLTVEEDPAYGAEPILHANTVTASIRLLSLWRGRLEVSTISVDEASLNLVRTSDGRWNLDSLFRTAAQKAQPNGSAGQSGNKRVTPLPYIEATNSRINFKRDAEKLPFSLVATDLSFWQEQPGDWRIRLRGQPARTDLSLDLADTGLVRLEARAQQAPELRLVPIHLDLEWQEAQLGQLARLVTGSDPGWRGDLTGELHVDGTADSAEVKTRLRATGVHRVEFAPAVPMDFDASCGFLYRLASRSTEHLVCDSPLGDGHVRLAGDLPGNGDLPHLSVELDRIPVAAGLDALRTVRSDFGPGLEAAGSISGKISYAAVVPEAATQEKPLREIRRDRSHSAKTHAAPPGPLTGSLMVEGFQLSGDGLTTPIQESRLVLEPAPTPVQPATAEHAPVNTEVAALHATVNLPAGGPIPLALTARLALSGYEVTVRGQASVARARELAHVAGVANASALDALAGEPLTVDLGAEGPWLPTQNAPFTSNPPAAAGTTTDNPAGKPGEVAPVDAPASDSLHGTVTLRNANWKAAYLANHVEIAQATLHLGNGELRWDPVDFSYGPVKGTASLNFPAKCEASQPCLPKFEVHFGNLDASALQAAILGAREPGTMLSTLIARFRPSSSSTAPAWPPLEGTVTADSLILGPVTLTDATATLRILATGAEITDLDADLLGGHVEGGGTLRAATEQDKPAYTLEGHFEKLSPAEVGNLMGLRWTGRSFDADGKIDLSGFTGKDLADSVNGTLHFDWQLGAVAALENAESPAAAVPAALGRFDRWTGDAEIANGTITLKQNQVQQGFRKRAVQGALTLGDHPTVSFVAPSETQAKR
jgi:hypothetical protein